MNTTIIKEKLESIIDSINVTLLLEDKQYVVYRNCFNIKNGFSCEMIKKNIPSSHYSEDITHEVTTLRFYEDYFEVNILNIEIKNKIRSLYDIDKISVENDYDILFKAVVDILI